MFVCVLSDECGSQPLPPTLSMYHPDSVLRAGSFNGETRGHSPSGVNYSYGWSFLLAVAAFLGAEISAILCFSAFLNRFDSEVSYPLFSEESFLFGGTLNEKRHTTPISIPPSWNSSHSWPSISRLP